jgi:hypothetical protein
MWGVNLRLHELLFGQPVPLTSRMDCIRSPYHVYSDYVSKLEREPDPEMETGFYMWWDLILHGFWDSSRRTWRGDASKLDAESRALNPPNREALWPQDCRYDFPHGLRYCKGLNTWNGQ